MNFSEQTYNDLAQYERYFRTATEADWCPNPGRAALDRMQDALDALDGRRGPRNHNCGTCLLRVVKRTGFLWLADKEERQAAEANGKAERGAQDAPEAPLPTKTPSKKTNASTAKKTAKK